MFHHTSKRSVIAAILAVAGFGTAAHASIITEWTFETSMPATAGPLAPEVGITGPVAKGSHAGAAAYSTPAGNGSSHSFSSNTWAVGDYYEFDFTAGTGLFLTFDQTSSSTGPRDFKIQTSTDGTTFSDLSTYSPLVNGSPNVAWNATTSSSAFTIANVALPSNTGFVRLVDIDTTSEGGSTVATAGTDRVDNVIISDTPQGVPEPTTLVVLGLGAISLFRRRNGAAG